MVTDSHPSGINQLKKYSRDSDEGFRVEKPRKEVSPRQFPLSPMQKGSALKMAEN